MKLSIYVMTSKESKCPRHEAYRLLYLGESSREAPAGALTDATGDNISTKNKIYSELTGLYWMTKNDTVSDYLGLCHYRRFFVLNDEAYKAGVNDIDVLTDPAGVQNMLDQYDIILPKLRFLGNDGALKHYNHFHRAEDMTACRNVIEEFYPRYVPAFEFMLKQQYIYCYNMFITSRNIANDYAQWLFDILAKLEKIIYIPYDDKYQRRLLGFLAERLFNVYVWHNRLKILDRPILFFKNMHAEESGTYLDTIANRGKETLRRMVSLISQRRPVFMGDSAYKEQVVKLFNINPADYHVLNDDKKVIRLGMVNACRRPYAVHIFFTDGYDAIKKYWLRDGLKENIDFINALDALK